MRVRRSLYLVVLKKGVPSPLARESDEEKGADKPGEKSKDGDKTKETEEGKEGDKGKDDKGKEKPKPKAESVVIDFDGIDAAGSLPSPSARGNYANLHAGTAGQIYYLEPVLGPRRAGSPSRPAT